MAEHEAQQGRYDDRPAENADLAETGAKRWFGFLKPRAFTLSCLPGGVFDAVGGDTVGGDAVGFDALG